MDDKKNYDDFKMFIDCCNSLQRHFKNQKRKMLQKFDFVYSFDRQLVTGEILFTTYLDFNDWRVQTQYWSKNQFLQFDSYVKALHDLIYATEI